jgi:hypothetical protein
MKSHHAANCFTSAAAGSACATAGNVNKAATRIAVQKLESRVALGISKLYHAAAADIANKTETMREAIVFDFSWPHFPEPGCSDMVAYVLFDLWHCRGRLSRMAAHTDTGLIHTTEISFPNRDGGGGTKHGNHCPTTMHKIIFL